MSRISLPDFFEYYKGTPEQKALLIVLLESAMPETLLRDNSAWVRKYREQPEPPPAPAWPITKAQMAAIMLCSEDSLPDSLMDDYARCVANCQMDTVQTGVLLGPVTAMSQPASGIPWRSTTAANYEGRQRPWQHQMAGASSTPEQALSRPQVPIGTGLLTAGVHGQVTPTCWR